MKILYVTGPVNYRAQELFTFGPFDAASIYSTRFKIINIFDRESKNEIHIKSGYGEEDKESFLEYEIVNRKERGAVVIIPSGSKIIDIYRNYDLIVFERVSTGFFEIAHTQINTAIFIPDQVMFNREFLEVVSRRSVVLYGHNKFYQFMKNMSSIALEDVQKQFSEKGVYRDLIDLMYGRRHTPSLQRIVSRIVG